MFTYNQVVGAAAKFGRSGAVKSAAITGASSIGSKGAVADSSRGIIIDYFGYDMFIRRDGGR